jgi:hypothetical protein
MSIALDAVNFLTEIRSSRHIRKIEFSFLSNYQLDTKYVTDDFHFSPFLCSVALCNMASSDPDAAFIAAVSAFLGTDSLPCKHCHGDRPLQAAVFLIKKFLYLLETETTFLFISTFLYQSKNVHSKMEKIEMSFFTC